MSSVDVRRQLQALRDHLTHLALKATNEDSADMAPTQDALSAAVRALSFAETELRRQAEALDETRFRLDAQRMHYQALFDFAPDAYIITDLQGIVRNANNAAYELLNFEQPFLVGKPLALYVALEDRQQFRALLVQLESSPVRHEWEFRIQPRAAKGFDALLSVSRMEADFAMQQGQPALRWFMRDISEQKLTRRLLTEATTKLEMRVEQRTYELRETNERLQKEITERERAERAEHEQRVFAEALRDTALGLTGMLDLTGVLDKVLINSRRVVRHDAATIALISKDGVVTTRSQYDQHPPVSGPTEDTLSQYAVRALQVVLEQRVPIITSDGESADSPFAAWLPTDQGFRSGVGLPLLVQEDVIGVVLFLSQQTGVYSTMHVSYLQAFAATAASAIRNVMAHEQSRALARAEERQRFARELHDAVTQTLFTASLIADSLPYLWKQDPSEALVQVEQIKSLNRGALAEMRTLLLELRPEHLAKVELVDHLKRLVSALQARKNVEVDMMIDDGDPLPQEVRFAFYRIAQEAINNIVKHARATHVQVRFVSSPVSAQLSIEDNGVGFVKRRTSQGIGIETMHERAKAVGARLDISSRRHRGTTVSVVWLGELSSRD